MRKRDTIKFLAALVWAHLRGKPYTIKMAVWGHRPQPHAHLYPGGSFMPAMAGGETPPAPPEDPPADPPTDPPTDPPPADPPADPPPSDPEEIKKRADAEVAKAYEKLRQAEQQKKEAERKLKEKEDAEKSELERAQSRVTELEGDLSEATKAVRRANLMVELVKPTYQIAPDAVDLVADALEIDYDDSGRPQGVEDAVEKLLEDRPSLKARPSTEGDPTSPGNPAGGKGGGTKISTETAKRLATEDPDEFNRLYEEGKIPQEALAGKS